MRSISLTLTFLLCTILFPTNALILNDLVPMAIRFTPSSTSGAEAAIAVVTGSTVSMCTLDWDARRANPASTPMYRDLIDASPHCRKDDIVYVPWTELEADYEQRGCGDSSSSSGNGSRNSGNDGCVPRGGVFHQSRCGSTLIANLLASLPGALCYSESGPVLSLLTSLELVDLPDEARIRFLRVLMAAFGRPVAAARAAGKDIPPTAGVYLKFQSRLALQLPTWRAAFPAVPWAFVYRNGTEILASNFRGAKPPVAEGATLDRNEAGVKGVPCMSSSLSPAVLHLLGERNIASGRLRSPEDICSAYSGVMALAALDAGGKARDAALGAAAVENPPTSRDLSSGKVWAELIATSDGRLSATGASGGIGQGVMIDYATLPESAFSLIFTHFGLTETPDLVERLHVVSKVYSKKRTTVIGDNIDSVRAKFPQMNKHAATNIDGDFTGDTEEKLDFSWSSLRAATARYMEPSYRRLLSFNVPKGVNVAAENVKVPPESDTRTAAPLSETATLPFLSSNTAAATFPGISVIAGAEKNLLPLGGGYPAMFPLNVMLRAWNPDVTLPPSTYGAFSSLRVFNFSVPLERELATKYRRAEVPFVIRGVPTLDKAVTRWADDETLVSDMGKDRKFLTEISDNQHFMYFNKQRAKKIKDFVLPTREGEISVSEWLLEAKASLDIIRSAEHKVLGLHHQLPIIGNNSGHVTELLARGLGPLPLTPWAPMPYMIRPLRDMNYMRASTTSSSSYKNEKNAFILDTMQAFTDSPESVDEYPFFIIDPKQQRGIHCRFGMAGIIAEPHTDAGRNFISMQRGHKRYILAPPFDCDKLGIARDGPIARHSEIDWSSEAGIADLAAKKGLATEVIINPGDALYVPAGWFHYIISLDTNIQCNSRSGTPALWEKELEACSVAPPISEALGERTDLNAMDLQPSRALHLDTWRKLWPIGALEGLAPELAPPPPPPLKQIIPISMVMSVPVPKGEVAQTTTTSQAQAQTQAPPLIISPPAPLTPLLPFVPPSASASKPGLDEPIVNAPIALPITAWIGTGTGTLPSAFTTTAAAATTTTTVTSKSSLGGGGGGRSGSLLTWIVVSVSIIVGAAALCVRYLVVVSSRGGSGVLPSVAMSKLRSSTATSSPRTRTKVVDVARDMLSSGWRKRVYAGGQGPVVLAELIRTTTNNNTQSTPTGVGLV